MSNNMKLIDAIMNGDAISAREEFTAAINDRVNTVLDIRRITMASDVFNQVQEATHTKKEILNPNYVKDLPEECEDEEIEDIDEAYVSVAKRYAAAPPELKKIHDRMKELSKQSKETLMSRYPSRLSTSHMKSEPKSTIVGGYLSAEFSRKSLEAHDKYFYEGVEAEEEMDEANTPGQKFDMNKVNAGAMSRDEYNKKYKLGKYRPAGNKLAGSGGLYKNLVKNP